MYYNWDIPKEQDLKYGLLNRYFSFLGSVKYSNKELSNAFYKIGCDYKFYSTADNIFITLSGLDENMEQAMSLLEDLLAHPVADTLALTNVKQTIRKGRKDQKAAKDVILRSALVSYATYGSDSPFTYILSEEELQKITSNELLDLLQHLRTLHHKVLYYGPRKAADLKTILSTQHKAGHKPVPVPTKKFTFRTPAANEVYWVNYNMIQAEMIILNQSDLYDKNTATEASIFNEYFGGGMGSLVFQEIRESKALAYSAKSTYTVAQHLKEPNYQVSYMGTQADKTEDALDAMLALLNEFPYSEKLFDNSIASLKETIASERITKMNVIAAYEKNKSLGITYDVRKDLYDKLDTYTYKDLLNFHAQHIKGKTNSIVIVGSKDKIDFVKLQKYGTVKELTLEEVFGY